jgi:hypothetical protein
MAYNFTINTPGSVNALELVRSIYDMVDEYIDVLYTEILWRECIPAGSIKYNIPSGAMNYVYPVRDQKGMGQFLKGSPKNIPMVNNSFGQVIVPILDAAVGAEVTNTDAKKYAMGFQASLAEDLGGTMRLASDRHVERDFFFGNALAGFYGYLDYTGVSLTPLDAWTGTDSLSWATDLNDTITSIVQNTKFIHFPDTIELAPSLFTKLNRPIAIDSTTIYATGIEYLKKNNITTATKGTEITIKPLRYLEGAGVDSANRIIINEINPRNFVLPFPVPYQLTQPVPIPLGAELYASYIFGSFHIRYMGAMAYVDVAAADES